MTHRCAHGCSHHTSASKIRARGIAPLRVFAGDAPTLLLSIAQDALRVDPVRALEASRALARHKRASEAMRLRGKVALGNAWRTLGKVARAIAIADDVLARLDRKELAVRGEARATLAAEAHALRIRCSLRSGDFAQALRDARKAERALGLGDPTLRAAHAAALYRNQHFREAADGYWKILEGEPFHVEALIRLGSGLLDAQPAPVGPLLERAVAENERGQHDRARVSLVRALGRRVDHPIALRVLGEIAIAKERRASALVRGGFFARYFEAIDPGCDVAPWTKRFFPDYKALGVDRRRVLRASARPFGTTLLSVLAKGGSHDLLASTERTTDAASRAWLRGTRTFDGRVWDDVRGIGGLCAATGVEALDEAHEGGFQTLVHELAHQLHFHAMTPAQKARVDALYAAAKRHGRCLDYYAASNAAEYFAQGFEAWYSLVKAPGQPITHGHTRFELERRDPELATFIRSLAVFDPLSLPSPWIADCSAAALEVGAHEDAEALLRRAGGRVAHPGIARRIDAVRVRLQAGRCSDSSARGQR